MGKFLSKQKGNSFERKVAKILSEAWKVKLIRTPCSGALKLFSPGDLTCENQAEYDDFPFELELKNRLGWHLEQLISSKSSCPVLQWWVDEEEKQYKTRGDKAFDKTRLLIFTKNFDDIYVMYAINSVHNTPDVLFHDFFETSITFCTYLKSPKTGEDMYTGFTILSLDQFLKTIDFEATVKSYKNKKDLALNILDKDKLMKKKFEEQVEEIWLDPNTKIWYNAEGPLNGWYNGLSYSGGEVIGNGNNCLEHGGSDY